MLNCIDTEFFTWGNCVAAPQRKLAETELHYSDCWPLNVLVIAHGRLYCMHIHKHALSDIKKNLSVDEILSIEERGLYRTVSEYFPGHFYVTDLWISDKTDVLECDVWLHLASTDWQNCYSCSARQSRGSWQWWREGPVTWMLSSSSAGQWDRNPLFFFFMKQQMWANKYLLLLYVRMC